MTLDAATVVGPTGQSIAGRYLIDERLGSGGMAVVYQATDEVLGRKVAVKLFGPAVDSDHPERIKTEMRTLAALSHPGLVSIYDAGTDEPAGGEPRAFLVMELIEGPNLGECLREGPLDSERVSAIGACVADALAYIHGVGVVHRDIKPANILLDHAGRAHLTDFGVARTIGAQRHTATGMTIGTAAYLSPEQVTGGELTPAVDIYALGLTLLEALTGRREYPGAIAEAALARLTRVPEVDGLPAPWPDLITWMTALDPASRPSPEQVREALTLTAATELTPQSTSFLPTLPIADPPLPATTQFAHSGLPGSAGEGADSANSADSAETATLVVNRPVRTENVRAIKLPLLVTGVVALVVLLLLALFAGGGKKAQPSVAPAPSAPASRSQLQPDLARLYQLVQR